MCGIAGIITKSVEVDASLINAEKIQFHRGPDYQKSMSLNINGWKVGLSHQRLSIIDLSVGGNQPMASNDGNYWISYNGEVYNYKEIRSELKSKGYRFKSESDTEVILKAFEEWGIHAALNRFNGMWAFALLDRKNRRLIFARDRVGMKPFYYYLSNNSFYFASEIKTIIELSKDTFSMNPEVAGRYLFQNLLDTSSETFFSGIKKLPQANYGELSLDSENLSLSLRPYWNIPVQSDENMSIADYMEKTRNLIFDSVKIHLRSDVQVGVLLSGGVDSSAIAAAAKSVSANHGDIKLFSAVSNDPKYDESKFINIMQSHLDVPIEKINVNTHAKEAFKLLDELTWFNDEPVPSFFSSVAHYLLIKEAKQHGVTVLLTGQGADELFCGYLKYIGFAVQSLLRQGKFIKAINFSSMFVNREMLKQIKYYEAKRYLPGFMKRNKVNIGGQYFEGYSGIFTGLAEGNSVQERQAMDIRYFSVPAITHLEDRMSMACSCEMRVPFLDHRLIELAVPSSMDMKLNGGWTKYILRKAMEPYMPPEITWRRDKKNFTVPLEDWLKKDLKEDVRSYFNEDSLIFKYKLVNRKVLIEQLDIYNKQPNERGTVSFKDIMNPLTMEIWLRKYEKHLRP